MYVGRVVSTARPYYGFRFAAYRSRIRRIYCTTYVCILSMCVTESSDEQARRPQHTYTRLAREAPIACRCARLARLRSDENARTSSRGISRRAPRFRVASRAGSRAFIVPRAPAPPSAHGTVRTTVRARTTLVNHLPAHARARRGARSIVWHCRSMEYHWSNIKHT